MKRFFSPSLFLIALLTIPLHAQTNTTWRNLAGAAMIDNKSYDVLERICDEAGGRLMGTPENDHAIEIMLEELRSAGLQPRLEPFTVPGWTRGNDVVTMRVPVSRTLRASALGYVDKTPRFDAAVVSVAYGAEEDYAGIDAQGKIVLIPPKRPSGRTALLRSEMIDVAAQHGAKAILFINSKPGGLVLCGTGNFQGTPTAIPAYSVTYEEGTWMRRLLDRNKPVELTIETQSYCTPVESNNIVVTIPGRSPKKIVIGAHFDAWDLGNGGIDNGLGTAILYDVARYLSEYTKDNAYTIECVWFNGEEMGLWGARKYVEQHKDDPVIAMINMDMTGDPKGFNAMGFDAFVPLLKHIAENISGLDMSSGVGSNPWTNSDHMYFMFAGIPSFTMYAHLEKEMVDYYHDFSDTFDKVSKVYLSRAAAAASILGYELANADASLFQILTPKETGAMLRKHKLDERLKRQKEWHFPE